MSRIPIAHAGTRVRSVAMGPILGVVGLLALPAGVAARTVPISLPRLLSASPDPTAALAPPVPAEPGRTAPDCTVAPQEAGSWTRVYSETRFSATPPIWSDPDHSAHSPLTGVVWPAGRPDYSKITVDRTAPCRLYRSGDTSSIDRSDNGGRSWSRVFADSVTSPLTGQPFQASEVISSPATPRTLLVPEKGNGDALLRSDDAGRTWSLSSGGIGGQAIADVGVAPSDPTVVYAVTDPYAVAGAAGVYVSRDSGLTWSATTLPKSVPYQDSNCLDNSDPPCQQYPDVAVDPGQPGHVYALISEPGSDYNPHSSTGQLLLESGDYGTTWSPLVPPPVINPSDSCSLLPGSAWHQPPTHLLATRSRGHGLRLYIESMWTPLPEGFPSACGAPSSPYVSSDDGRTWSPIIPVSTLGWGVLAADPLDNERMVYVGVSMPDYVTSVLRAFWSTDGFVTSSSLPPAPEQFHMPMRPTTVYDNTVNDPSERDAIIQTDSLGDFYVPMRDACSGPPPYYAQATGCFPGEGAAPGGSVHSERQTWWRLTFPVPRASTATTAATVGHPSSAPPSLGSAQSMTELRDCPLPVAARRGGRNGNFGSLAFDGVDLLYTVPNEPSSVPYTGVIRLLDPSTCADQGALAVAFSPADLAAVANDTGAPPQYQVYPTIDTMTYDPGHSVLWLSLASDYLPTQTQVSAGQTTVPVFSVSLTVDATGRVSTGQAAFRFYSPSCDGYDHGVNWFSYDITSDTIWSCVKDPHGDGVLPARLSTGGLSIPSCVNRLSSNFGTWTLGAPGRIYIQTEDDQTIEEVSTATCTVLGWYEHRTFGEPGYEDEQMACDSLTFSAGSLLGQPTAALWLRDTNADTMVAYAIPDGVCPYPTVTRYLGTFSVTLGGSARLCAQLTRRGIVQPIARRPIDFTLAGIAVGRAVTDSTGTACVAHAVTLPGGPHAVQARFLGDQQYLPSQDSGTLTVTVPPATTAARNRGSAPPLVSAPPFALPVTAHVVQAQQQPEAQYQAEAQAQTETQVQAQVHTMVQAQPGVMLSRQERVQVAAQQRRALSAPLLALRVRRGLVAVQVLGVGLSLSLGLLLGAPAVARARRPQRLVAPPRSRRTPPRSPR